MSHYTYTSTLKCLYDRAKQLYREGNRDPSTYFTGKEKAFLDSIGAKVQEVYDFVDDAIRYGEPDYETFILIASVRRDYFLYVQKGVPGDRVEEEAGLPEKTAEVRGIRWLPRLIPKARARLRGELPDSLMYGCGGDREFFRVHDIHPADFLRAVWAYETDDEKLVDWVQKNSKA
ncbi:MAG: DUF5069 domain-containing protein [Opitutaceae bacterium]